MLQRRDVRVNSPVLWIGDMRNDEIEFLTYEVIEVHGHPSAGINTHD
jgi:hypothetical protein